MYHIRRRRLLCAQNIGYWTLNIYYLLLLLSVLAVCGNVCCVADVVKDSVFKPWSGEVCCVFV